MTGQDAQHLAVEYDDEPIIVAVIGEPNLVATKDEIQLEEEPGMFYVWTIVHVQMCHLKLQEPYSSIPCVYSYEEVCAATGASAEDPPPENAAEESQVWIGFNICCTLMLKLLLTTTLICANPCNLRLIPFTN